MLEKELSDLRVKFHSLRAAHATALQQLRAHGLPMSDYAWTTAFASPEPSAGARGGAGARADSPRGVHMGVHGVHAPAVSGSPRGASFGHITRLPGSVLSPKASPRGLPGPDAHAGLVSSPRAGGSNMGQRAEADSAQAHQGAEHAQRGGAAVFVTLTGQSTHSPSALGTKQAALTAAAGLELGADSQPLIPGEFKSKSGIPEPGEASSHSAGAVPSQPAVAAGPGKKGKSYAQRRNAGGGKP